MFAAALVVAVGASHDAQALALPAGFSTVEQVAGLDVPTALAYAPDGRLFVAEKAGRVLVVDQGGRLQSAPVIDIRDHVNSYWDRGLLGLAVDADFATNHFLYLAYTYESNALNPSGPKTSRLTRITVTGDNRAADLEAPETVIVGSVSQAPCPAPHDTVDCIPSEGPSHSIGTVRSDPDGTLWLGSGDAASFDGVDPTALRTYDERSFAGKLLHVDREGRGLPGHPFCPQESDLTKVCTKLYAKGFRNPFRFQLRPSGGPIVGDVGWESREELDLTRPGRSYGWPCYEGAARTPGYEDLDACAAQYAAGPSAHDPPAHDYPHAPDAAIVPGPRYEAGEYPASYRGAWFFLDYAQGLMWTMRTDDGSTVSGVKRFATGVDGAVDLERAPNGDLVYASAYDESGGGSVQRIVYGDNRQPVAIASATPSQGVAPLTVTLGAEGSADPDGEPLTYEWDVESDGTVDATGPSVSHTYAAGAHTATLRVEDPRGLRASSHVEVLADESPPTVSLLAPVAGSSFRYGRPIELRGTGADRQDGVLDDRALHWRITIHHGAHTHVVEADRTGRELSFTPPLGHDADSFLEFRLTARDSAGLETARTVIVRPETVDLRLESSPPGAVLSYAGTDVTAPAVRPAAVGFRTTVSAPETLDQGNRRFAFDHWSDGGARLHDIAIPAVGGTLRASYRLVQDLAPPATRPPSAVPALPPGAVGPIELDDPIVARSGRRLRGRVRGVSGRVRVDVALRSRRGGRGCRWWNRSLGRLSAAPRRCDRSVWMKARVDAGGRWRLDLRGRARPGRYVVVTRVRTASARPRLLARATSGVRIARGARTPRTP